MAATYGKRRTLARMLEGVRAAREGKEPEDCPYAAGSKDPMEALDADYWTRGYVRARNNRGRRARTRKPPT